MTIKLNYLKKTINKPTGNIVLFSNEKFKTNELRKYLSNFEFSYINDLLKNTDLKKNLYIFELSSKRNIILVSIKKDLKISDIEKLGAEFFGRINNRDSKDYFIISDTISNKNNNLFAYSSGWRIFPGSETKSLA